MFWDFSFLSSSLCPSLPPRLPPSLFLFSPYPSLHFPPPPKDDRVDLKKEQTLCGPLHSLPMDIGVFIIPGPKHLTGPDSFSTAESATYCLVKNAVKMFKDIGVSVHRLCTRVCIHFCPLCLDLFCLSHLCVGLDPERSSFCRVNHAGISGDWEEEGHVESEAPPQRFI